MFTKRQIDIIGYILNAASGAFAHEISKTFSITTRTLRNEVMEINKLWNDIPFIQSNNIKGYYINREYKNRIRSLLYRTSTKPEANVVDQKLIKIALLLYISSEKMNKYDLSELLYISEPTLIRRINEINADYKKNDAKLIEVKGDQVYFNLNEIEIRNIFITMIRDEIFKKDYLKSPFLEAIMAKIFLDINIDEVEDIISNYFNDKQIEISKKDIGKITYSVCLNLARDRKSFEDEYDIENIENAMINDFFSYLQNEDVNLSATSQKVLTDYLITYNVFTVDISDFTVVIVNEFIDEVLLKYNFDLRESNDLYSNLLIHFECMINRIESNLQYKNPMVDHIIQNYPFAYEISMLIVPLLYHYQKIYLTQDEIAYIAVYINHFLLRYNKKLRAFIMPNNRKSITEQVESWLEDNFNNYIEVVPYESLDELNDEIENEEIDIVFSFDQVVVHPKLLTYKFYTLPSKRDYNHINELIYEIKIQRRINNVIDKYFYDSLIHVYNEKTNLENAITKLTMSMKEEDIIEDYLEYSKDVIEREKIYSTYKDNGVIVPHAIFNFTKKTSVGIAIFKKPITVDNRKIKLMFLLGTEKKENTDLAILFSLFDLCSKDEKIVDEIIKLSDPSEILDFLKNL